MNKFFNTKQLVQSGEKALKLIEKEINNLEARHVVPKVEPGFLRSTIPEAAPEKPEDLDQIISDTQNIIIPNLTQWQHPNFYAYFPSNMSTGAILGDMIALAFNTPGFTWVASPASTELENIVVDWVVKFLGLPEKFLLKNPGGGTIANTIGDAIFLSVHAAKYKKTKELGIELHDPRILKLVGYYTGICHSQNNKGLFIKDIPYRREVPIHFNKEKRIYEVDVKEFEKMVEKDIADGLIPFWCGVTIGSTSLGSKDPIDELADICNKHGIYVNVDAAWAGGALVVPEIREELGTGLEKVDSICINFGKWMMCGNNSALFFVADKKNHAESLLGGPIPTYLQNKFTQESDITDYKDWQIGLGRRFNSLRFWFMIRSLGVEGMRANVNEKIELAKEFEALVNGNERFELIVRRELSLVCFRMTKNKDGVELSLEDANKYNKALMDAINATNEYHLVGSTVNGLYFLRFVVCNHETTSEHIKTVWKFIEESSKKVFEA